MRNGIALVSLTEDEYWVGASAIKHAINEDLNMDDDKSLSLNVVLVHIPFVLKIVLIDETLVVQNNPHDICYRTTLRYVWGLLNEPPKVGLWPSIGNLHWSRRVRKFYDIVIRDFADLVCGIYGYG